MISTDEARENHILSLHEANGDLIRDQYSFSMDIESVGNYGAIRINNGFGDVKWSPNGYVYVMQICYRQNSSRKCELNLYTPEGEPILSDPISSRPSTNWSPDGEWLAYTFVSTNGAREIHLLKSDGSEDITLIDYPQDIGYPKFSPDGSRLLYWAHGGQLRLVNVDGSNNILVWEAWWGPEGFNWSPDGSKIVLSRIAGGLSDIFFVGPDGTGRAPIYRNYEYDIRSPRFSPDGEYILFETYKFHVGHQPTRGYCIYTVPSDLSTSPRLVGTGWSEQWSPDSNYVLLIGWPLNQEQGDEYNTYAVLPDASGYIRLNESERGIINGIWQPGSFANNEYAISTILTYEVPQNLIATEIPTPLAMTNFVGIWQNLDTNPGVTRIEMRELGNKLFIRMWGSCHPEDCYWGETSTDSGNIKDKVLEFTWDLGYKISEFKLQILSPGYIDMIMHDQYTDSSIIKNITSLEKFIRIIGEPSYEPISSCPPVLGEYDPEDFPPP